MSVYPSGAPCKEVSRLDAGFLDYLPGASMVYADRGIHFGRDEHETTHSLAALFLPAWRATPGAVSWVRRVLRVPLSDPPAELPFPRRELRGLPVRNVRWQVGLRLLDQDEPRSREDRAWILGIVNLDDRNMLHMTVIEGEPTPEHLWEHLLRTMARPGPRDPVRPSKVELADSDCYDFLNPKLSELGAGCSLMDELPQLQEFCQALVSSCRGPEKCALVDGTQVTLEQMESFYYAAARYFEQASWKHVAGEIPIEIRCRGLGVGTLYAIVLGRTGVTMGLALYRGWNDVLAMLRGLRVCEEMSGFSVIYDEIAVMAPADLYLVQRNGWPICTPEAYPVVLRFEPGQQPQSPRSEELDYLETCLRIIPDFVTCKRETKTYETVTNGRQLKMRLSWTFPRS